MNWSEGDDIWRCAPYLIARTVRGFECWIYSLDHCGRLARDLPTVEAAKAHCVKDAADRNTTNHPKIMEIS